MNHKEMTFEETTEVAKRLHGTITGKFFQMEKERHSSDPIFQGMTPEQKDFFPEKRSGKHVYWSLSNDCSH